MFSNGQQSMCMLKSVIQMVRYPNVQGMLLKYRTSVAQTFDTQMICPVVFLTF